MKLDLGSWVEKRQAFGLRGVPAFAGISGGRTSAMMSAMLDPRVVLTFQNTGREHPNTLTFLQRLEDALQRPIVWLEWRPPPQKGDPPRKFGFEVISFRTAARNGEPFRACLQALADFRATKGEEPIAPWAKSRICTAYLKHKVKDHYVESLEIDAYDTLVGLRYDEPHRVSNLQERDTQRRIFRCPLFDAGIMKDDVLAFWSRQSFDLELQDYQGNCTACFLKDQSDLSRVLGEEETDAEWWEGMETDFENFGGQRFPGYRQLRAERPVRLAIEGALRAGEVPVSDGTLDAKRFRLVMLQEKKRLAGEREAFSCACEQTVALADGLEDAAQ